MKFTLEQGRPVSVEGRLEKEIQVYDFLDELGIQYERVDHPKADTMEACREIDEILQATICKNLFLCNRQKTAFYLLMMPGDKSFRTSEVSRAIGSSRLSFGTPEDMGKYLDVTPGSATVLGLMNDKENVVQLVVDADILQGEYLGCHACINTSSLKLRTKDVFEVFLPAVAHEAKVIKIKGE